MTQKIRNQEATPMPRTTEVPQGIDPGEIDELDVPRCQAGPPQDAAWPAAFELSDSTDGWASGSRLSTVFMFFWLFFGLAAPCLAQDGWNRGLDSIGIVPTGERDSYRIEVAISFSTDPSSVPVDMSSIVEVYQDGTLLRSALIPGTINAGSEFCGDVPCNGSCGTGYFDGVWQGSLLCYLDGPPPSNDCDCGQRLLYPFEDPFSLEGGELLVFVIRAANGAMPDPDPADDRREIVFSGGTHFWNRGIESVEVRPTAGAPGLFDVTVRGYVEWDGQQGMPWLDLGTQVDLYGDDVFIDGNIITAEAIPASSGSCFYLGCGEYCGVINNIPLNCDNVHFQGCVCGGGWISMFPGVPWDEQSILSVVLRPTPGALPELPGFEEDDERRPDETSSSDSVETTWPTENPLSLTGPNPMSRHEAAHMRLNLDRPSYVQLQIVDAQGRSVRSLADSKYPSGSFDFAWDGRNNSGDPVANGVYFTTAWVDRVPHVAKLLVVE